MCFDKIKLALSAVLLSFVSCVEDLTIDIGSEEGVAVDCVLRMQKTQTLRLYKMKEIYGSDARSIEDATVVLSAFDEKSGEYSDVAEFEHNEGLEWSASYLPEYGVKYKLTVNIPGKDRITAETRFPEDLRLMVKQWEVDIPFQFGTDGTFDTVSFYIPLFRIHKANTVLTLLDKPGQHPEVWDFKYVDGEPVPFREYRESCQDSCKLWVFPHVDSEYEYRDHPDSLGNVNHLYPEWYDFHGASKPYVKFAATDHPFVDRFNLLSGTVSDLRWCNIPIKKYVTGFEDWKDRYCNLSQWPIAVCPDLPLHDSFLRIAHPANFVNHKYKHELEYEHQIGEELVKDSFYIIADFSESFGHDDGDIRHYLSCAIETHFVSEEYDSYLKDLYIAKESVGGFILSAYEAKHIYSNVVGGYGIFGAENVTWDETTPWKY